MSYFEIKVTDPKAIEKELDNLEKKLQKTACPMCKKPLKKLETHRRLTQYADDTKNWLTCCKECIAQDNEHYKAMWKDYYESQGFGETFY